MPFLHFNTFLLSRHAFVKNEMQCSKTAIIDSRILNFVLENKEQPRLFPLVNTMQESDYNDTLFINYGHGYVSFSIYAYMHLTMENLCE